MQIQYVLTQKVSNPQLVCERFHVCNQSQLVSNGKWSEGLKEVLNKKYLVTGHRHQATGIETPDTSTKLSTGVGKELLNVSKCIRSSYSFLTSINHHGSRVQAKSLLSKSLTFTWIINTPRYIYTEKINVYVIR